MKKKLHKSFSALLVFYFTFLMLFQQVNATVFTVTNTNDAGAGSLRQAILDANADLTATAVSPHLIIFSVTGTITIGASGTFMVITNHLLIDGGGQNNLTISGGGTSRIFWIQNGTVLIQNLTLSNGAAIGGTGGGGGMGAGGAIFVHEGRQDPGSSTGILSGNISLTLFNVTLENNQAVGGAGGGISGGGGMGGNGAIWGSGGVLGNANGDAGGSVTNAINASTPGTNGGIPIFGNGGNYGSNVVGFGGGGGGNRNGGFGGGGGGAADGGGAFGIGGFGGGGGGAGTDNNFTNNGGARGGYGGGGGGLQNRCITCPNGNAGNMDGQPGFGGGTGATLGGGGMGAGGAIFLASGSLQLNSVTFKTNSASGGTGGNPGKGLGGALFIFNKADNGNVAAPGTTNDPTVTASCVTYTGNTASDDAGTAADNDNQYGSFVPSQPQLTINDVQLNEGDAGTTVLTFTVSLCGSAGPGGVTFDISTQDNSATIGDNDYVSKTLTNQTIPAGSSSYSFEVTLNGDLTFESDESFFVNVTNVVGATVSDGQGQGTITNDDVAPPAVLTLTAEGPSGTVCGENVTVTFKVKDFTDIGTLDFSVNWDDTKLQYVSHSAPDIDGYTPLTGPALPINNALTYTWYDAGLDYGSTLPDGTIILTLNFTVLSTSATGVAVNIMGTPTALNASDLNFEEVTVTPENLVSFDVQKVSLSDPTVTQPTCPTPNGTIVVNATGPGTLEYSVNNGADWFLSNSFSGLAPGSYDIKVRLQSSPTCEAAYSGNPVVLNAATGCCVPPDITAPAVTQPNCTTPTGTIVVNATGGSTLEYSINNGTDWYTTNTFENLAPGSYNIKVRLQSSPTCEAIYSGNPVVLNAASGCCVLTCPTNITVGNDAGVCGAYVTYPAASAHPDCGAISYSKASGSLFPIGTTTVTVNAASGQSCSFTVRVNDTEAPVITTKSNPTIMLWAPNHSYQTITVAQIVTGVSDNCGSIPVSNVRITKVTSDEPENAPGSGDGNTKNDIKIKSNCKSVDLRRERQGSGNGRVYTIHLAVTDAKSNTGTTTYKVYVPHNMSGNNAIDNGPVYTVNSSCGSSSRTMEIAAPAMPDGFTLEQNIPNPFTSATVIRYTVPEEMRVSLAVYNNTGQKVAQLVDARMGAGYHQVKFESSKLAAGIYLYRMETVGSDGNRIVVTKKMIIAK